MKAKRPVGRPRKIEKIKSNRFAPTNVGNATNVRNKIEEDIEWSRLQRLQNEGKLPYLLSTEKRPKDGCVELRSFGPTGACCFEVGPDSKYPITTEIRKQDQLVDALDVAFSELEAKLVKVLRPSLTGGKTARESNKNNSPLADHLHIHNTKLEDLFQKIQDVSDRIEMDYE